MNEKDTLAWFEEIQSLGLSLPREKDGGAHAFFKYEAVSRWVSIAETALSSVLPHNHVLLQRWQVSLSHAIGPQFQKLQWEETVYGARGVFDAACVLLKTGRLSSFVEGIRAETVSDLLDQADYLADQKFLVAATVVAGGSLETFLHFKCTSNNLSWGKGHGSIEKYKDALAQARNGGNQIISATEEKQVTAWGGIRNDAAHKPAEYNRSLDEVRLMIAGIRQFMSKYGG